MSYSNNELLIEKNKQFNSECKFIEKVIKDKRIKSTKL